MDCMTPERITTQNGVKTSLLTAQHGRAIIPRMAAVFDPRGIADRLEAVRSDIKSDDGRTSISMDEFARRAGDQRTRYRTVIVSLRNAEPQSDASASSKTSLASVVRYVSYAESLGWSRDWILFGNGSPRHGEDVLRAMIAEGFDEATARAALDAAQKQSSADNALAIYRLARAIIGASLLGHQSRERSS
jgi:hypothetical protein